jgi:sulfhydrogenase subunit beta (sulfur reductase)
LGDPPYAILGIRSCDLHALAIHDGVLRDRAFPDARYAARRERAFLITVVCSDPSGTCVCVSMGTGPRAEAGDDLAVTELLDGDHRFLVRSGSDRGDTVVGLLKPSRAAETDVEMADQVAKRSAERMGRAMDTTDIRNLL